MLLCAVSRAPLGTALAPLEKIEHEAGPWKLTAAADNSLTHLVASPESLTAVVSLDGSPSGPLELMRIELDRRQRRVRIVLSTAAGRSLFYWLGPDGEFVCSTHIKLLRQAGVPIEENRQALPELFVYRYVTPPRTLYRDIFRLPFGGQFEVDFSGEQCRIVSQSRFEWTPAAQPLDRKTAVQRATEQISNAVAELAPISDRLAVTLSGGIDSSILFRLAQRQFGVSDSYSTGYPFEGAQSNIERQYAETAAHAFGAQHCYFEPTLDDYRFDFLDAVAGAEEPLHHLQSVLWYSMLRRGMPAGADRVLVGQGPAQNAMGMPSNQKCFAATHSPLRYLAWQPCLGVTSRVVHITRRGKRALEAMRLNFNMNRHDLTDPEHPIWRIGRFGSVAWARQYLGVTIHEIVENRMAGSGPNDGRSIHDLYSAIAQYGDCFVTQIIWSKIAEAAGRELVYPYGHPGILDVAYATAWPEKLGERNIVFRSIARRLGIDDFIVDRPKAAFGIQAPRWSGPNQVFGPFVALASNVIDSRELRALQRPDAPSAMTYWTLLNYALWKRLMIDNQPLDKLRDELAEQLERSAAGST